MKTFRRGGIHPPENKLSRGEAVVVMPPPAEAVVMLGQHIGAPAVPTVAKGDRVVVGQLIGKAAGFVSANVHAPVSGVVTAVDAVPDGGGVRRMAVTIKTEGDEWDAAIDRSPEPGSAMGLSADASELSPQDIVAKIAAAGVVGMGGATFPTQVKLSVPEGKRAEYLIINGVECEPYLTADHRVMLERGEQMLAGVQILARALGVSRSFVGIENNKPDAIANLRKLAPAGIEIVPLKVQYPQGGEKQLIDAVLRREVPSGGLPLDAGAVVQNVGTALAVYEAVVKNKPLIDRVVTVTGHGLRKPQNVLARVGTPISSLIEFCGGASSGKVVNGGPMMGRAMSNVDAPVTKGTSGVLLLAGAAAHRPKPSTCIKCAKCAGVCPMGLEPWLLSKYGERAMWEQAEVCNAVDCIECGSCSFTCPAALPLLDYIRLAKSEVLKARRTRK